MEKNKGLEIPFWQNEWFYINFSNLGIKIYSNKLPDNNFYSTFYEKLFEKYKNFEDLPLEWKSDKELTAIQISKEIPTNAHIFSFGCGTGYIEKIISEKREDIKLVAFDYSKIASKWIINDLEKVTYTENLDQSHKFDVIYICQVLYALSTQDCINILTKLKKILKDNGKIVIVNSSCTPSENGNPVNQPNIFYEKIKLFLKPHYMLLKNLISKKKFQFWGWERDNKEIKNILLNANLKIHKTYPFANQSFIIAGK
tara:strand:- start:3814 stop:4581 length:768 start_codon:yes stop_codon:yes gene_type:complete